MSPVVLAAPMRGTTSQLSGSERRDCCGGRFDKNMPASQTFRR